MIENKVAPWTRPWLPLVCDGTGKVLSCAGLWAQREDVPLYLNKKVETEPASVGFSGVAVPALVSGKAQARDKMQVHSNQGEQRKDQEQILLALAVRRCSNAVSSSNV